MQYKVLSKFPFLCFIKHWKAINLYLSSVRYVQNQTTHTINYATYVWFIAFYARFVKNDDEN